MSGLLPLLKLIVDSGAVSPKAPTTTTAVTQTEGSLSNLAGGLFGVGPITEIKQPVVLPKLTQQQATTAYLQAATGKPEKIGTGGRF